MNAKLIPLTVLDHSAREDEMALTPLQKLVYLIQSTDTAPTEYEYRPGRYGPVSDQLTADLAKLVEAGFITETTRATTTGSYRIYTTTEKAIRALDAADTPIDEPAVDALTTRYQDDVWTLLDRIAWEWPSGFTTPMVVTPTPAWRTDPDCVQPHTKR